MNDAAFAELVASVREGGAILRGELAPSKSTELDMPDIQAIRSEFGLTQEEFGAMLGISVSTLRNWEQGRRRPAGAAMMLLHVAARHPEALLETIRSLGGSS
ncbi:MAG: NadS family protein [Anaerolineae bacterium]